MVARLNDDIVEQCRREVATETALDSLKSVYDVVLTFARLQIEWNRVEIEELKREREG